MPRRRHTVICPSCASNECRRSRRKNVRERVFSWAGIYPFRCRDCRARFWLIGHRPLLNENLAPVQFLLIILANLGRTVIDLIS